MTDERAEPSWQRTVLQGLAALAAAAVIIGVAVGVMMATAANLGGVGKDDNASQAPETLFMPSYTPTPLVDEGPIVEGGVPAEPKVTAVPLDPTDGPTAPVGEISLNASPTTVSSGEKINLSGVYVDGEGVSLQVQRQEGDAWVDFPTQATVRGGAFSTYVYTGRFGDNVFRVFDPTTGRSSNPVTVTIG